jgi:hypothetical protein
MNAVRPEFFEGPDDELPGLRVRQRFFAYRLPSGLVTGKTLTVTIEFDEPARVVWPHLKDFNPWQNLYDHYYSVVLGDSEGAPFGLSSSPGGEARYTYRVERVIPEHLIAISQTVSHEDRASGRSPDFHVFLLDEHGAGTVVTALMEHSSLASGGTVEENLRRWREMAEDSQMKWRDIFVPKLRGLVAGDV